jgi:lysophospholipase L1-like esterase
MLVCLSGIVSFLLAEAALRIAWDNPYRNEVPDRLLVLPVQHPNTHHVFNRAAISPESPTVEFRTDERGYILPSRRFKNPDATVAFLGGSTTECSAVAEGQRFPARVSTLLEANGHRVDTLNAGRSGNTAHDSLNVLLNVLVQDAPDVAVLMHAANDIGILTTAGSYAPRMGKPASFASTLRWPLQFGSSLSHVVGLVRRCVSMEQFRPNMEHFVQLDIARSIPRVSNEPYEQRLRAFVRLSRAFGIVPVLMTQPLSNVGNAMTPAWADANNQVIFNQVARRVGAEEGVVVIDLVRHLIEDVPGWNEPMRVLYDGMHVNDAGSEIYARYITKRLEAEVLGPLYAAKVPHSR